MAPHSEYERYMNREKSSFEKLADDLNAGGTFIPQRGVPGYATNKTRYQTMKQTEGRTFMDDDGEDAVREDRYINKLNARNASEARILKAYEKEEAEKAEKHRKSVAGMRRMREQYEASIKADELRRTRVSRKKVLVHDGERLYRDGEQINGKKGVGGMGRQSVFPFTKWSNSEELYNPAQVLDADWVKHVAGKREASRHSTMRGAMAEKTSGGGPGAIGSGVSWAAPMQVL